MAVIAVVCVAAGVRWLAKPLPPPVVSLSLAGFKVTPTNAYAVMTLTNLGPTRIYFDPRDWALEFETPNGVATNFGRGFSFLSIGTKQHANEIFYVELPTNVSNWRVEASFHYYKRRHARLEFAAWTMENGLWNYDLIRKPFEAFDPNWVAKLEPSESYGSSITPWLTNLPPAAVLPE